MIRTIIDGVSRLWVMYGKPWFIFMVGYILILFRIINVGMPAIMCLIEMNLDCCMNCMFRSSLSEHECTKLDKFIPNPRVDICSSHKPIRSS